MGRKKNKSRKASGQNSSSATFESPKRVENERKYEKSRKAKDLKVDKRRDQKDAIEHGLQNQTRENGTIKSKASVGFDHESVSENRETSEDEDASDRSRIPKPGSNGLTECATGFKMLDAASSTPDSDVVIPEETLFDETEQFIFVPQSSENPNINDRVDNNNESSGIRESSESALQPELDEVSLLAFEDVALPLSLSMDKLQDIKEQPVMPTFNAQIPQAKWNHRGYSLLEPKEQELESSFVESVESTSSDIEDQQSCQLPTTPMAENSRSFSNPVKTLSIREIMMLDSEDSDSGTDTSSVVGRFKFEGESDDDDDYQESSGQTMKDIPYVFKGCRDYKQLSQEKYFAMSNEEKAEKIIHKMAPSPEEIANMDPVEQFYAIDQKRTELEVATRGDYTIGDTLNEIQKFDPTAPGYSEMGIIKQATTQLKPAAGTHGYKNVPNRRGKKKSKPKNAKEDINIPSAQHHKVRVFHRSEPGPVRSNKISHPTDSSHPYASKPSRINFEAPPRFLKTNNNQNRKTEKQQKTRNREPKETRRQGQRDYVGKEIQTETQFQQRQPSGRFDSNSGDQISAPLPHQQFKQHTSRGYDHQFRSQGSKENAHSQQSLARRTRPRFQLNPDAPTFRPEQISPDFKGAAGYTQPSASTAFLNSTGSVPRELLGQVPQVSEGFMPKGAIGQHQIFFGSTSADPQLSDPAIIGFGPPPSTDIAGHHFPNHPPLGIWMKTDITANRSSFPPEQPQVYHQSVQDVQGPVAWNGPLDVDIDSLDMVLQAEISQQMLPPWWDPSKSTELPQEYVESLNVFSNLEF